METTGLPAELKGMLRGFSPVADRMGGSRARVYRYERGETALYLKLSPINDEIRRERDLLLWLKGRLPVPDCLFYAEEGENACLLSSEMRGSLASVYGDVAVEPYAETVARAAEGLKLWQSVDIGACPYSATLDDKLALSLRNIKGETVSLDGYGPGEEFASPMALYHYLTAHRPPEEKSLTHGDYCLPNLFIKGGKISGFIDFGRGGVGCKWQDIAICTRSLRRNLRHLGEKREEYVALLFKELGIEQNMERVRYYCLLDRLVWARR
ncbi:MAG: aminoglycoside 3'-phosphotransferase [Christensenellaceae bacterium]|jgi:kanamycin kinase/aminoglycoside 3'-phosphotransferase-3|nr:aminoglycoside 3'-phosphotransferase [Christensenellaceae bacterium]